MTLKENLRNQSSDSFPPNFISPRLAIFSVDSGKAGMSQPTIIRKIRVIFGGPYGRCLFYIHILVEYCCLRGVNLDVNNAHVFFINAKCLGNPQGFSESSWESSSGILQ